MICIENTRSTHNVADSKTHGANMGPTWVLSAPDGAPRWPHEPCYQGSATFKCNTVGLISNSYCAISLVITSLLTRRCLGLGYHGVLYRGWVRKLVYVPHWIESSLYLLKMESYKLRHILLCDVVCEHHQGEKSQMRDLSYSRAMRSIS